MEPLRSGDPRRISSYEILNRLGAGGMGQVYLGRSPSGRRVAVKVIRPELTNDPTFRQRFRREVTAMRQVSGFFTAPVVDADPDGDPAWLATAFVPGPSLESAVSEGGPMSHQDVLLLAAGLAEALNAIHREGLTHRDLKPGNVLMAEDGPRVIDFGLAITAESVGLTQAGTVVGTPAFMSPEQVSGQQVGPASDIWSLGAVLAYAATAASPFGDGGTMDTMLRVMNGEPDLSGLTGTLAQLVSACMMKDPYARPTPARILQVLSEGAGVQATMAIKIQVPGADDAAQAGGDAGGGTGDTPAEGSGVAGQAGPPSVAVPSVSAPSVVTPSVAAPSVSAPPVAEPSVATPSAEAPRVQPPQPAQPAWPTAQSAAQAASQAASSQAAPSPTPTPTPTPTWGTAQTAHPTPDPNPVAPVWGSGQVSAPAPTPSQPTPSHPTPSQPTPSQPSTPAPAWGSQASTPAPPSTPQSPAWGSGQMANPGPVPPSQPPAWGSGAVNPPPPAPTPAWGAPAPGPISGPSTPPQPMPAMPSNQWGQSGQGQMPMYQNQGMQAAPWSQQQQYGMPMQQQMPAKKNRNGLFIAIGVGAVVVIGGIIAIVLSSGSSSSSSGTSGGSTGGTTTGTLGGTGTTGPVTPIPAAFPLHTLVTDADAAQYLKATPTASAPVDNATDDPATFDEDWLVDSAGTELRVQATNYKTGSQQAITDFGTHISTLATDAKFEDQGALGNSNKTEIQIATDQSSGLQHCKIEILRGGLDVTVTFVESGSAANAHTDVVNLAKLITGRLPAK